MKLTLNTVPKFGARSIIFRPTGDPVEDMPILTKYVNLCKK